MNRFLSILIAVLLVLTAGCIAYLGMSAQTAATRAAASQSASTDALSPQTLQASASYTLHASPDRAHFTVGIRSFHADAKAAQEQNAQKMQGLIQALTSKGLTDSALQTANYSVHPEYDYRENTPALKGYTVLSSLSVTVDELKSLGGILTAAAQSGANEIYGIEFSVKNYDILYSQALEKAVAATREKAASMAMGAGVTLSDILSIQDGNP
ncbi:MAG: SIMPL domain-containing protein, partial [Christensenellales bacterium]